MRRKRRLDASDRRETPTASPGHVVGVRGIRAFVGRRNNPPQTAQSLVAAAPPTQASAITDRLSRLIDAGRSQAAPPAEGFPQGDANQYPHAGRHHSAHPHSVRRSRILSARASPARRTLLSGDSAMSRTMRSMVGPVVRLLTLAFLAPFVIRHCLRDEHSLLLGLCGCSIPPSSCAAKTEVPIWRLNLLFKMWRHMKTFVLPILTACALALALMACDVNRTPLSPVQPSSTVGSTSGQELQPTAKPGSALPQTAKPVSTFTVVECRLGGQTTVSWTAARPVQVQFSWFDANGTNVYLDLVEVSRKGKPSGSASVATGPQPEIVSVIVQGVDQSGTAIGSAEGTCS